MQAILIFASSGVVEASESIALRSLALRKTKTPECAERRSSRATQPDLKWPTGHCRGHVARARLK
jgi:hypothetical protein